jgi:hypothetical protein
MALERPCEKEIIARDALLERQARRDDWMDRLRVVGQLALSVCAGLALMGMALHTTDVGLGRILWLAGQTAWLGGCLFTLLAAYRRAERRGGR